MKEDPTRTGEMRKAQGRYLLPHLMIESTTGPYAVATFSKSNEIYDNQERMNITLWQPNLKEGD